MSQDGRTSPVFLKVLSALLMLFGLAALFGSLFLWGEGFLLSFPPGVDYAFPVTDLLVNAPASILAAVGLWKLRRYGFFAAWFVAGFYIYASVEIFVRVAQGSLPGDFAILLPQLLAVAVALALILVLRRMQDRFA